MRHQAIHYIYIIGGLLMIVACKPGTPKEYIQPKEMEDILYDYFVGQGMVSASKVQGTDEFKRDFYFNTVLNKHGVSRADFDSSMVYYYTRADRFVEVMHHVQERLRDDALNLGTSEGEVERYTQSLSGDTTNVWEGNRLGVLVPYAPYNRIQFEQKADTSYRKGDSFLLTFKSDFLYQSGSKNAMVYLAVKYANDSIVSKVTHFSVSGNTQLRINKCDERVKSISGYFYLGETSEKSTDLRMLFLTQIQFIRFHKTMDKDDEKTSETAKPAVPVRDTLHSRRDSMAPPTHRLGTFKIDRK